MSVKNRNSIVTDGLVFYVDAGNEDSYPGTGSTVSDLVGSASGTFAQQATYSSADGGSFVFDGTDDHISFGNIGSFTSATFSCWVKRNGSQTSYTGLMISRPDATGIGIMQSGKIWYFWNGANYQHNSNLSISDGSWEMVTVTLDSSSGTVQFYKNTTSGTSDSYNGSSSSLEDAKIGIDEHAGDRALNGNIACFSIYNRALSSAEVAQNYNALKNRFI